MVDPVLSIPVFSGLEEFIELPPTGWDALCQARGLLALAAEQDEELVGFAVAESSPQVLHILTLKGDPNVCRLLLQRLVMLAGERDVSGWFPLDQVEVRKMVERLGFVPNTFQSEHSCYYRWNRNQDVDNSFS
jgi:hypothetical protein